MYFIINKISVKLINLFILKLKKNYNIININYILNIISILYFIQQVMIENKQEKPKE